MFNKDLIKENTAEVMQKMSDALAANDVEAATEAMQEMQGTIAESIEKEFQKYGDSTDMQVLQSRGLRALTSEEQDWYEKFIGAVNTGTKQAITDLDKAMPVTIFDRVLEDMKKSHPLLDEINIQNAAGAMRLVLNGTQMSAKLGSWKPVGSAISDQEIYRLFPDPEGFRQVQLWLCSDVGRSVCQACTGGDHRERSGEDHHPGRW